MKEIKDKIRHLIEISNRKINRDDCIEFTEKTIEMESLINEIQKLARKNQTILGRIMRFPYEDKYSYYLITKINEIYVTIEYLDLLDGFVDKAHGKKSSIDKIQAECYIRGVESILKMFPTEDIFDYK